jgi:predicted cupin superfamily sugar epimerase
MKATSAVNRAVRSRVGFAAVLLFAGLTTLAPSVCPGSGSEMQSPVSRTQPTAPAAAPAAPLILSDARARELIRMLKLHVLPGESGYLGIIGRSAQIVAVGGRSLAVQSQNYYMLTHDRPINYLHWLAPDDTHILIEGGPVDYFIFHPDGRAEKITLGMDFAAGQRPVVAVPGGCWKALRLHDGVSYALMANTLSPEFTSDRVKIGAGPGWVKRYLGSAPWATSAFLRELIGPNWLAQ